MAKKDDTTQEGVESGEQVSTEEEVIVEEASAEEEVDASVSDRDQMMADLAKKQRNKNAGLPLDHASAEEEEEDPGEEEPDELPPDEGDETGSEAASEEGEELVTLKVDGEEVQVTQAEVDAAGGVAAIQKSMSGDRKLAAAAEERKKLKEEQEKIDQVIDENKQLRTELDGLRDMISKQTEEGVSDTPESQEALKAKAKEITDKFFLGDAEELQAAVESILVAANKPAKGQPTAEIDENIIAERVTANLKIETERKEAVADFEKNHADLNTPGRRKYVNELTAELLDANPLWGPKKVIAEAIKQTRLDLELPAPAAASDQGNDLEKKKNKKRKSVDTIPAAHQRGPGAKPAKQPKTPDQIFAEMKGQRSHQ